MGCGASANTGKFKSLRNNHGVSVEYLVSFARIHTRDDWSTSEVVREVIIPATSDQKCRMLDTLDSSSRGVPKYFLSHRWADSFSQLIFSLSKLVEEQDGDPAQTYVWLDIFAVNQHFLPDLAYLSDCMSQASMVLLVLDSSGGALSRIWCLYEIWKAVTLKGADQLTVLVGDLQPAELECALGSLDAGHAMASVAADQRRLLADINTTADVAQVNQTVRQALVDSSLAEARRAQAYRTHHPAAFLATTHKCAVLLGLFSTYHDTAEKLFREALEVGGSLFAPDDPEILRLTSHLGSLLRQRGKLEEAEGLLQQAVALSTEQLGHHHPDTLAAMASLVQVLGARGRVAEALPLSRAVLSARKAMLGPCHPRCAISLNDTAMLLQAAGQLGEAETMLQLAVEIWQRCEGVHHCQVAATLSNLSKVLSMQKRLPEALDAAQRAQRIRIKALGPGHNDVATGLNSLGQLRRAMGQPAEAMALFRQALAAKEALLGSCHSDVASVLNNMALTSCDMGKLEEAEELARRALQTYESVVGAQHALMALAMNNLGMVLEARNRRSDAKELYTSAVEMSKAIHGPQHPDTINFEDNLRRLRGVPDVESLGRM